MEKTFSSYYPPNKEDFSKLWQNCVFILDANILLNLYRYPKEARDDLLKIFRGISDRIWIPHQAALEYQKNRLSVIAEQIKKYDEIKKILTDILTELKSKIDVLQLQKRHSVIKPDNFLKKIEITFNEFKEELDKLKEEQPDLFLDDQLRTDLDALFEGKIGFPPETQEKLDRIYDEGVKRYEQKRPPGYMDKDKKEIYTYKDLIFKAEYNDLVLWYQIIDQAKAKKEFSYIIFITDDDKEDWWWRVESGGKKTIGPRPELLTPA